MIEWLVWCYRRRKENYRALDANMENSIGALSDALSGSDYKPKHVRRVSSTIGIAHKLFDNITSRLHINMYSVGGRHKRPEVKAEVRTVHSLLASKLVFTDKQRGMLKIFDNDKKLVGINLDSRFGFGNRNKLITKALSVIRAGLPDYLASEYMRKL